MHQKNWPAGQAAFVTGAASGIGLGIARALVAAGARVALTDIDEERLAQVARELSEAGAEVVAIPLDVGDAELWEAAADRAEKALGPISILCNIAGVNGGGRLDETPLKVWQWVYRINIEAQFIGISTFLPRMKRRGGPAHILNTASVAGMIPMTPVGAYSSSKFASLGLSLVLRDELEGSKIGVSLLVPGSVATRINITAAAGEARLLGLASPAGQTQNASLLAQGADPDSVGEQVVEAMRDGQFYIVTHREWLPIIVDLQEEVVRAFTDFDGRHGGDPTAEAMLAGINPIEGRTGAR